MVSQDCALIANNTSIRLNNYKKSASEMNGSGRSGSTMTKTSISQIRRALNECEPVLGQRIERAMERGDSFRLMELIEDAISDLKESEATEQKQEASDAE